jgi:hypothetical protein
MTSTAIDGRWQLQTRADGTLAGRHLFSDIRWHIEPDPDQEGIRLTVFPDATTYGWLRFQSEAEAIRFVLGQGRQLPGPISRQIAQWLKATASNS